MSLMNYLLNKLYQICDFPDVDFDQLLLLANEYQITHLKQPIENQLLLQGPSLGSLVLADMYGLTELRKACLKHAMDYKLSREWLSGYRSAYDQLERPRNFRCQSCNAQQEEIDFTKPWEHSDITFIVEGQKVYANKMILSMASPVMKETFETDLREKYAKEIELPGNKFGPFLDLMKAVHPPNLFKGNEMIP